MLKRPPPQRVDAPIIFVHPSDPAWDTKRVVAEQTEMKARGELPAMHPVSRYQGGWTRYDLDAAGTVAGQSVSPRDYLDLAKHPTMWKLRRLSGLEWYEVNPLVKQAGRRGDEPDAAYLLACIIGLESVENGPLLSRPGGRLGPADIQLLHDTGQENGGIDLVHDIGEAVYQASMPLTESEKKH